MVSGKCVSDDFVYVVTRQSRRIIRLAGKVRGKNREEYQMKKAERNMGERYSTKTDKINVNRTGEMGNLTSLQSGYCVYIYIHEGSQQVSK